MLWASQIYDIFGSERFYAELMGVFTEDNYSRTSMIAKRFGLTKVVTTDTHFVRKQDFKAHKIACISRKGFDYSSQELWLKTRDEILGTKWLTAKASQAQLEELLDNTVALAEKIETFDLSAPAKLPKTDGSIDIVSLDGENKIAPNYKKRLDYETGVIVSKVLLIILLFFLTLFLSARKKELKLGRGEVLVLVHCLRNRTRRVSVIGSRTA